MWSWQCAAYGQRQEPPRNDINPVIDRVVVVHELAATGQEPQTSEDSFVLAQVELIGGKLLEQKLVVRQIVIERTNDVIAIRESKRAVGRGVSGHIQPVTAPALAVMRRGQQSIHDSLVRLRRPVRHEGRDLFRRRRQADQVVRRPPDQRSFVRRPAGCNPLSSSLARMKASTGDCTQHWFLTGGISRFFTG